MALEFEEARMLIEGPHSCLKLVKMRKHIILPPKYLGKLRSGVDEQLRSDMKLYSESFGGVLVAYENLKLVQPQGSILDDSPYLHFDIEADFIVFKPQKGNVLEGVVHKVGADHVGCLVHGCYNATIPKPNSTTNQGWTGSQLSVDDYLQFEVLQVVTEKGVFSIIGKLADVRKNKAKKVKDAMPIVDAESLLLSGLTQSDAKKKKRKRNSMVDPNDEGILTMPNRKRAKKEDVGLNDADSTSQVDVLDAETATLTEEEEEKGSKKKKKKKKKHSVDLTMNEVPRMESLSFLNSSSQEPSSAALETLRDSEAVPIDEESSKKKKKKKKRSMDHSESLVDEVQELTEEGSSQKKKKKKKHSMDSQELFSTPTADAPKGFDPVWSLEEQGSMIKRKKKHSIDTLEKHSVLDSRLPNSDLAEVSEAVTDEAHGVTESGKKKKKKRKRSSLLTAMAEEDSAVDVSHFSMTSPELTEENDRRRKKKRSSISVATSNNSQSLDSSFSMNDLALNPSLGPFDDYSDNNQVRDEENNSGKDHNTMADKKGDAFKSSLPGISLSVKKMKKKKGQDTFVEANPEVASKVSKTLDTKNNSFGTTPNKGVNSSGRKTHKQSSILSHFSHLPGK